MRMRTLLPLIGLLALGACKDEKKADTTNTSNPPAASTTAPANPTSAPGAPANPAPANKPGAH
jgi:hypothetical protein